MIVSASTSTSASITQVSGRKMVTPAAISRLAVADAHGCVERDQFGDGVGPQHFGSVFRPGRRPPARLAARRSPPCRSGKARMAGLLVVNFARCALQRRTS